MPLCLKLDVADQLGHGLGVNLDVYTVAALDKRQDAVEVLGSATECCSSVFSFYGSI